MKDKIIEKLKNGIDSIKGLNESMDGCSFPYEEGIIISGNEAKFILSQLEKEMHLNMQYYMEYCESNGYVTPQDWLEKHKHF